jgi:hypothetical protein
MAVGAYGHPGVISAVVEGRIVRLDGIGDAMSCVGDDA